MKKLVSLVLAMLMVFALCSTTTMADAAKTEITYWFSHSGQDMDSLVRGVEDFEANNPDVDVKYEFIGGSGSGVGITDKLTVAINGNTPPEAVLFDRFMVPQWASQDLFEEVTDAAAAQGVTEDRFFAFAWEEASLNGKLYAFPFDTDCRALFYNKKMLADAGYTEAPKTIDELYEVAKATTKMDGNRIQVIGLVPWTDQGSIFMFGWAFGGQLTAEDGTITANDPKFVEAGKWMQKYAADFGAQAISDFSSASGSDLNPFAAEMQAMTISGPWNIATIRNQNPELDFGVAPVPTPTGDNFVSWAGGWSHIIPKGIAKDEAKFDAAVRFLASMTVGNGATFYGEDTTHFMSCIATNDELSFVKNEDPAFKVFLELFPESYCRPAIPKGQLLWDEMLRVQNLWVNDANVDVEALLTEVSDKVNAEMAEYK